MKMIISDYAGQLDKELERRFGVILETTGTMNEMIDALLDLAHATHGEMRITQCDMKTIFREAWKKLKKESQGRNISFILNDMPRVPADCRLIKQVVYNLLANSVKCTSKKTEAVIEAGGNPDEGNIYYVKDNGAGFAMTYDDRLFTVFQRLHSAREYKGTGIGFPIVRRIIVRHGGKVWAKGEIDKGATFYFSLPGEAFRLT